MIETMKGETDGHYYIELSFAPSIELISIVRRFVGHFFELALASAETSARLAMAVHELLENAVKFSVDGDSSIRVDMTPQDGVTEVLVSTRNRATSEDIEALEDVFRMLEASGSPMAFYIKLMERSTRSELSQLGIGRVCAEAGMQMSVARVDDVITVKAVMRVPRMEARS
jgi:anti-sigma regulatory factor (Ser/Thr protein kinase)